MADIKNIPEVVLSIFSRHLQNFVENPFAIRNYTYILIDEKTFEKVKCE